MAKAITRVLQWVQHYPHGNLVQCAFASTYPDGKTHTHEESTDDPKIRRAVQRVEALLCARFGARMPAPPPPVAKPRTSPKVTKKIGGSRAVR